MIKFSTELELKNLKNDSVRVETEKAAKIYNALTDTEVGTFKKTGAFVDDDATMLKWKHVGKMNFILIDFCSSLKQIKIL